jgi:glycogen synthase
MRESTRVIMLSWEYPPRIVGGISRVVQNLARELRRKNNEVHVVTCRENDAIGDYDDEGIYVHRANIYGIQSNNFIDWVHHLNFALLEECIKLIDRDEKGFDIIHAHDWMVAFCARVLKHSYNIPVVCTIHATEAGRNNGIQNDLQRYISNIEWWLTYESWKVVVNSRYMFNEVSNLFQLPEDKIVVIPNGVNSHKFDGCGKDYEFRRKYALDNEKIVFFVGRLVNEKGAHILIDSIPKIIGQYHDVKFIITGRGPQFDYLRTRATELGVSHKVYLTGYVGEEELCKLYKCADMAVFPSIYEPFGIVALEAAVAGIPVVVSDTGGLDEILDHGVDGLKCYAGNSGSLADCILELLFNPDRAIGMAHSGSDKTERMYNWEIISQQIIELYRDVINNAKK